MTALKHFGWRPSAVEILLNARIVHAGIKIGQVPADTCSARRLRYIFIHVRALKEVLGFPRAGAKTGTGRSSWQALSPISSRLLVKIARDAGKRLPAVENDKGLLALAALRGILGRHGPGRGT